MATTIPQTDLGVKKKRNYFDLTHDVNTTSDFGFCQPTICRAFYKNTKISLNTREVVRLSAMPVPTFGRIEVRTHTAFVPVNDIFPAYDLFQSQKTVQSAVRSYIPQQADHITANNLLRSLLDVNYDSPNNFTPQTSSMTETSRLDLQRLFFRTSIWVAWSKVCPSTHELYSSHQPDDLVDVLNDDVIITNSELIYNGVCILSHVITTSNSESYSIDSPFFGFLNDASRFGTQLEIGKQNTLTGITESPRMLYLPYFGTYKSNRIFPSWPDTGDYNTWISRTYDDLDYNFYDNQSYRNNFLADMSLDNADFNLGVAPTTISYTSYSGATVSDVQFTVCLHATQLGRRVLKVFTGCSISFGTRFKPYELMRLFAYYKAWFDKYNPGRNLQWLDTSCFRLIHGFYDYGVPLQYYIVNTGTAISVVPPEVRHRLLVAWWQFLCDLPACCYVLPLDNMTCATETPLIEIDNNVDSINIVGLYRNNDTLTSFDDAGVSSAEIYGGVVSHTGGLGIQFLDRLYHLLNKNSSIGSQVNEYCKAHNISFGLPESNVLGDSKFMCNIDDVFSTVQNSESYLGEYAGKGIGAGKSDNMNFETKSFGYLIQFLCVVPLGGYVQGTVDGLINRYDFYQAEFDSLGMEPMNKSNFINRRYNYDTFAEVDTVFGFRPRYFKLKIQNNLANGGFAQRSQQRYFLPYSLDRVFDIQNSSADTKTEDYVADEELRYIGRYETFGNYDRIFYDTTGLTDNFIVHMVQDFKMWAPMRSISDSYDTYDKDVDDDTIKINKS